MTTRKLTRGLKVLVGIVATLALAATATAMTAHAAQGLAAATAQPIQGVLVFRNPTNTEVAGIELVFASEAVGGGGSAGVGGIYAFSGYAPGSVIGYEGCIWVMTPVAPGEELRVMLNQPYAFGELVSATWHSEARSLLQAIWKAARCAIL